MFPDEQRLDLLLVGSGKTVVNKLTVGKVYCALKLSDYSYSIYNDIGEEITIVFGHPTIKCAYLPDGARWEIFDRNINYLDLVNVVETDIVKNPKHYKLFEDKGIEVRHVLEKLVEKMVNQGYNGFIISDYVQMMQYGMRFMDKNGLEDLEKMRWYLDKMIETEKEKLVD